jgi:hypothetical protein
MATDFKSIVDGIKESFQTAVCDGDSVAITTNDGERFTLFNSDKKKPGFEMAQLDGGEVIYRNGFQNQFKALESFLNSAGVICKEDGSSNGTIFAATVESTGLGRKRESRVPKSAFKDDIKVSAHNTRANEALDNIAIEYEIITSLIHGIIKDNESTCIGHGECLRVANKMHSDIVEPLNGLLERLGGISKYGLDASTKTKLGQLSEKIGTTKGKIVDWAQALGFAAKATDPYSGYNFSGISKRFLAEYIR